MNKVLLRPKQTAVSQASLAVMPTASDHDLPSERRTKLSSDHIKTSIDDLPGFLLVEILCRLPSKKLVLQYKLVCKLWCTLLSDFYFIRRFLCLKSKTLVKQTVITPDGRELFTSSRPLFLSRLFKRLKKSHSLKEDPIVLGTFYDLVLCCPTWCYQRDYFICNPYTAEWILLPPPPQVYKHSPVGFICDLPYYNYTDDNDIVQVNAGYSCKVVRILPFKKHKPKYGSFKFKVETFSFETGDWRESIVSSPQEFTFQGICGHESFTYKGMLCWPGDVILGNRKYIIGLDPFMMENNNSRSSSSSTNGDDINYKCCFFQLVVENPRMHIMAFFGLSQGFPRLCDLCADHSLYVWELKEAIAGCDRDGTLSLIYPSIHPLDHDMLQDHYHTRLLQWDQNVKDILYLQVGNNMAKCNINSGEWSVIGPYDAVSTWHFFLSTELPWPTPVPGLPPANNTQEEKMSLMRGGPWNVARLI